MRSTQFSIPDTVMMTLLVLQADIIVNLLTGVEDQNGNRDYSLTAIA